MSDYIHSIRSFEAGPPHRSTGCDSCKTRKKRCPRSFDNQGRCHECRRLGLRCVRGHPDWLDDPDQLNSFKRTLRHAVRRNRQNTHQTLPREIVSGEMTTFVQRDEGRFQPLCDRSFSSTLVHRSSPSSTFVHDPRERTGFIPGQADPAGQSAHDRFRQPFDQTDTQIPFYTTPYQEPCVLPPSLPITSTPNPTLYSSPPFLESPYHHFSPPTVHPRTTDPADISPYRAPPVPLPQSDPPDSLLQLFIDHLRYHYPHVRHVVIEADNDGQSINALAAEATRVNHTRPAGSLMVSVLGR